MTDEKARAWNKISVICQEAGLGTEQALASCQDKALVIRTLSRCQAVADIYGAMSGDFSLCPPKLAASRQAMLDQGLTTAEQVKATRSQLSQGQGFLFNPDSL